MDFCSKKVSGNAKINIHRIFSWLTALEKMFDIVRRVLRFFRQTKTSLPALICQHTFYCIVSTGALCLAWAWATLVKQTWADCVQPHLWCRLMTASWGEVRVDLDFDSAANSCSRVYSPYLCHWCYHTICTAENFTATVPWRSTMRRRVVCTTSTTWVCPTAAFTSADTTFY